MLQYGDESVGLEGPGGCYSIDMKKKYSKYQFNFTNWCALFK